MKGDDQPPMEIDPPKNNENQYSLVIAEQCTGIVLDPTTLKRWTKETGRDYHMQVASLDEARQLATKIIGSGTELEVAIYINGNQFVEEIRNKWVDPASSAENVESRVPSDGRKPQIGWKSVIAYRMEEVICIFLAPLVQALIWLRKK